MTDYELVSLFYQIQSSLTGSSANFMAGSSAMLVVGYLAAHRLDRIAAGTLIAIFTLFSLGLGNEMRGLASDLALVGREITARAAAGEPTALDWHPAAQGMDFGFIWKTIVLMTALVYCGTVWFFFRSRAAGEAGFGLGAGVPPDGGRHP